MTVDEWRPHARRLADELAQAGVLTDPAWRRAVENVPRHLFLPGRADELSVIYSDVVLVTQQIEAQGHLYATSSSTAPSLMLRMLHELDVAEGMRVLEIGAGTGYNAALLCERLGDRNVASVDIDPVIVSRAYRQLKAAGYDPVLGCRDGRDGYPERAPYERLIATVAFEHLPSAWLRQVQPGGVIVADLRPPGATWMGALAKLTVADDGTAQGRLLECAAGFMPARLDPAAPGVPGPVHLDLRGKRSRATTIGADALMTPGLALMVWQVFPGLVVHPGESETTLHAGDGSWVRVPRKVPGEITYGGPNDAWKVVEELYFRWTGWGRPTADRFGIAVTAQGQRMWFEDPARQDCGPVIAGRS